MGTLADRHSSKAFLNRNRYMVEQSGLLLCYYDGRSGGTAHTVAQARRLGLEIRNLAEGGSRPKPAIPPVQNGFA